MKLSIITSSFRLITVITGLLFICNLSNGQIKVMSDGKIGIGTLTPSADLEIDATQIILKNGSSSANLKIQYLYGNSVMLEPSVNNNGYLGYNNSWLQVRARDIFFYSDHYYSDSSIKEDVKDLHNSLSKVLQMNGVKYKMKSEYSAGENSNSKKGKQEEIIGFIAQDLMDIVPEAVTFDSIAKLYAISYTRIIPLLAEAIKEMNEEFENLQTEFEDMRIKVENMITAGSSALQNASSSRSVLFPVNAEAFLKQNQPNPFDKSTTITYYLNPNVKYAVLNIYDAQGRQVKNIDIADRGNGNIVLSANELHPGVYFYSMIADSKRIGTRQMILLN